MHHDKVAAQRVSGFGFQRLNRRRGRRGRNHPSNRIQNARPF